MDRESIDNVILDENYFQLLVLVLVDILLILFRFWDKNAETVHYDDNIDLLFIFRNFIRI